MIGKNMKRTIRSGYLNFKRSTFSTITAILMMVVALFIITNFIYAEATLNGALQNIKDRVDVTIYFTTSAPEDQILSLKSSLEQLPEVASVSYTSADQALADFRARHSNDYPTIQALDEIGSNPLGAYLNIKAKEVSQYEDIANFLQGNNALVSGPTSIVDKVDYNQNKLVIDRLDSIISGAQRLGFLITFLLIIISIIITFNTIRLTIFISKEEIGVMRLVGASKMHVRGPFMIEGAIYGVIASLITMLVFWPATAWLGHSMTDFLGINVYSYYLANFFKIFAIILGSGIILGIISSFLAIRKYLNK